MPVHRLTTVTVGVPDVAATSCGWCQPSGAGTGVEVVAEVAEPITSAEGDDVPASNAPGRWDREHARSDALDRDGPVRPRKLGHVVVGSIDSELSLPSPPSSSFPPTSSDRPEEHDGR